MVMLVALMGVTLCHAQVASGEAYEKNLRELLFSGMMGNQLNTDGMKETFTSVASLMVAAERLEADKAEAKVQEYLKTKLEDDFASLVLPFYRAHLTAADVDYLRKRCTNAEGKAVMRRWAYLNSPEAEAVMMETLMPALGNAMQDKAYSIVMVDCPKSYEQKCRRLMEVSGTTRSMMESISGALSAMASQVLDADGAAQYSAWLKKFEEFMTENIPIVCLNVSYGKILESDLDYLVAIFETEAGQHMVAGNVEMLKSLLGMSQQLLQNFVQWVQEGNWHM